MIKISVINSKRLVAGQCPEKIIFSPVCCHQIRISVVIKITSGDPLPQAFVRVQPHLFCAIGKFPTLVFKYPEGSPLRGENEIRLSVLIVINEDRKSTRLNSSHVARS